MTWILKKPNGIYLRGGGYLPQYFTGAGFSRERRHAIRFTYQHWAVGMLGVLRKYGYGTTAKVVRLRRRRNIRCKDVHCACLKKPKLVAVA